MEVGRLEGENFEGREKILEAVVVAEKIVDLTARDILREFIEPPDRRVDAFGFGAEVAPVEVEGVAVEDKDICPGEFLADTAEQGFGVGPPGEQVEVRDDQSSFHIWVSPDWAAAAGSGRSTVGHLVHAKGSIIFRAKIRPEAVTEEFRSTP